MEREVGKNSKRIIKVIDLVSQRVAVLSVMISSLGIIVFAAMAEPEEFNGMMVGVIITVMSILLFLFLAPILRKKALIWRVICAILMFPGCTLGFCVLVSTIGICVLVLTRGRTESNVIGYIDIVYTIAYSISFLLYLTQYYLLLKDILFLSRENRKISERIIKVIDLVSQIVAVLSVMISSLGIIVFAGMVEPEEFNGWLVGRIITMMSILQGGLFLAPIVRKKALIWRVICAILMFPGCTLSFLFFPLSIIGIMVYLIQYGLLFKDINKEDILLKPIYLSLLFRKMLREVKTFQI